MTKYDLGEVSERTGARIRSLVILVGPKSLAEGQTDYFQAVCDAADRANQKEVEESDEDDE
jgi:hypothetical protein